MENDNKAFWKDKVILIFFGVSLAAVIAQWIMLLFYLPHTDNVALHYSVYIGIDSIGSWQELVIIPILGSVVLGINFLFGKMVLTINHFASFIFTLGTIFVEAFLLISVVMLYLVNR